MKVKTIIVGICASCAISSYGIKGLISKARGTVHHAAAGARDAVAAHVARGHAEARGAVEAGRALAAAGAHELATRVQGHVDRVRELAVQSVEELQVRRGELEAAVRELGDFVVAQGAVLGAEIEREAAGALAQAAEALSVVDAELES